MRKVQTLSIIRYTGTRYLNFYSCRDNVHFLRSSLSNSFVNIKSLELNKLLNFRRKVCGFHSIGIRSFPIMFIVNSRRRRWNTDKKIFSDGL